MSILGLDDQGPGWHGPPEPFKTPKCVTEYPNPNTINKECWMVGDDDVIQNKLLSNPKSAL